MPSSACEDLLMPIERAQRTGPLFLSFSQGVRGKGVREQLNQARKKAKGEEKVRNETEAEERSFFYLP
jgi:hypothetical protein